MNSKSQSVAEDLQDTNSNARAMELSDLFSFSARDLEFIVKFSEEHGSDIFRQILQSICPSIYGHELVKGIFVSINVSKLFIQCDFVFSLCNVKHDIPAQGMRKYLHMVFCQFSH